MNNTNHLNTKKMLIATVVMTAIASTSVSAFDGNSAKIATATQKHQAQTNNENIGFGTGAIIGGIAAGPLGAIVAGLGGVFIAKFINVTDENEELNIALTDEKQAHQLSSTEANNQYKTKIAQLKSSYQQQLITLENQQQQTGQLSANNLLMSLQFSTGSSDIASHYQEQVTALAKILTHSPTMTVDLSGYTDLTGEESLNQTLSQARVTSVKNMLMAHGVGENQIATFAFGEAAPVVANNEREVSFYDRRVVMKLHKSPQRENNQVAKNN